MLKRLLPLTIVILLGASPLCAREISLVGGANFTLPVADVMRTPSTVNAGRSQMFGLQYAFSPSASAKSLRFEFGFSYLDRSHTVLPSGAPVDIRLTFFEVPFGLRYYFLEKFSLSLGGYYALAFNSASTSTTSGAVTTTTTTTPAGLAYQTSDYGIYGGLAARIPVGKSASIVLEGRYLFGLANFSSASTEGFFYRNVQALSGIQFRF